MKVRRDFKVNVSGEIISVSSGGLEKELSNLKGQRFQGIIVDMSHIGLAFACEQFLPPGIIAGIQVEGEVFGFKGLMSIKAEITHSESEKEAKYRIGLKFIDLKTEYRDILLKFEQAHDTRRFPRKRVNIKIVSAVAQESQQKFSLAQGKTFEADIIDISEGGLGLYCGYFLPPGLAMEIEFAAGILEAGQKVKLKAEVTHCKFIKTSRYRCGMKFLELSLQHRKAIAEIVSTQERRKSPRIRMSDWS